LEGLLFFVLLREIQDEGAAEGGEVAVEGLGGVGGDAEEGAVAVGVFPSLFDGGAGLADATHAVDGALACGPEHPFWKHLIRHDHWPLRDPQPSGSINF
jgi:hypothetical protein